MSVGKSEERAAAIVQKWMLEQRHYLLDGHPQIVHPIAKSALVKALVEALNGVAPVEPEVKAERGNKPRARRPKNGGDGD